MSREVANHFLVDMYECDEALLKDAAVIESAVLRLAVCCGTTIVHQHFHRFSPHGVSGIVVIAESHISIHTWPEHRYAAVDMFTCGARGLPDACLSELRMALKCERIVQSVQPRGGESRCNPEPT